VRISNLAETEEFYLMGHNALYSVEKFTDVSGATCRLHLQGRRISQAGNQCEAGGKQSGLHGVISQNKELFITTAVENLGPYSLHLLCLIFACSIVVLF
jgi:hypothetical protein